MKQNCAIFYFIITLYPSKKGNILGVDIELTPSVSFEFGQENNNTMNATNYGKLTVKLPLGNKQKSTNFWCPSNNKCL
jgi:hypothetical protein